MVKNSLLFAIRLIVGGLFIFSGLIKINDPVGTSIKLEEYFDVFSNDIASFFIHFKEFSLSIAVFMIVVEVVLGIMLILRVRPKFTLWALSIMIVFFTFLTFYSAYFDKVTDCGCFGDAIKLTPWESFYKDLILVILIGILVYFRKDQASNQSKWAQWGVGLSLVLALFLSITAIRNLPFIDFRAYREGVNIREAMLPSAPLEYTYVMTKDGEKFEFDQYPSDDSFTFVAMNLKNEDALPKISDFSIWNSEGDFTEDILSRNKAIILVSNMSKLNRDYLVEISQMIEGLANAPIDPVLVAASSEEEIQDLLRSENWDLETYQGDATVIKTIMRSNPGIMLLKDGLVVKKYHFRNTPTAEEVMMQIGQ